MADEPTSAVALLSVQLPGDLSQQIASLAQRNGDTFDTTLIKLLEQIVAIERARPVAGLGREALSDEGTRSALTSDEASLDQLKARSKYRSNRCYLYFEVERKTRTVSIETSWLPDLPPVRKVLDPLGFMRESRGSWRTNVSIDDFVGVARRVTQAVELLLTEAVQLIE